MKSQSHRSTERALDILELLSQDNFTAYTLGEIATALDAPKSSLFPLIHTLADRGYISYDNNTYRYHLGFKAFEVGMKYANHTGTYDDILSEMQNIVKICSESCNFAELKDGDAFCLMKVDSPEAIRMFSAPGRRMPAYSTAIGKAMIAEKTKEEIVNLYPEGLIPVTEKTIQDIDILMEQLEEVRRTGVAMESEENALMIRCIAVPIKRSGATVAALSVAVPIFRYTEEKEALIIKLLNQARQRVEMLIKSNYWN
ncbi:MAG: IclR family transcriptional regulator [Sedimentibacter sp.]